MTLDFKLMEKISSLTPTQVRTITNLSHKVLALCPTVDASGICNYKVAEVNYASEYVREEMTQS